MMFDGMHQQPITPTECPRCRTRTKVDHPFCEECNLDLRYGSPGPVKSGLCIYCGEHKKYREEHIFPKWLSRKFPQRNHTTLHHLVRPDRIEFYNPQASFGRTYAVQGDPYTTTVRNVCAECNNRWKSGLQNQAAPIIERLACGEWPTLTSEECELIARWVAMVSINFQSHARILNASPHQRHALKSGSMPTGWKVSIGQMTNTDCAGSSFHRSMLAPYQTDAGKFVPVDSTYFCIERVAFYTLSTSHDLLFPYAVTLVFSDPALPTRPIWPYDPTVDPTSGRGLVLEDLVNIQRHFGFNEQQITTDAQHSKK